ncbi:branched-chain amino acid ABC transporter permease [Streptomyces sp. NPDC058424]|uniref:branched-chain amino acid ABC transporter permease n=1 Tax=Streptomyces sp. NPDC058424 TaxID=3346491 RepID=UPI00366621FC
MDFLLQQAVNGLVLGSVYALYASGFGLVMANLRIFHVAHAAVFTLGAVLAWDLTSHLGWPLPIALPVVAVGAGLVNAAAYVLLIRHLLGRRDWELAAFISSMGGLIALTELAHIRLKGSIARMAPDAFPIKPLSLGPVRITTLHLLMVMLALVMIGATGWILARTQIGREVRTVAFDRRTAALLAIDVDRVSAGVFFVSGAMAGVAASFVAMAFNVISADLGSAYLVIALAAMVVGGFGSVGGMLAGGLLIGLASTFTTGYLGSSYRDLVVFALLLVFLVLRPQGLFRTRIEPTRV